MRLSWRRPDGRELRLREILSEASRNVASGTSRALALAIVASVLGGALASLDVKAVTIIEHQASEYVSSGAATYILSAPAAIDGDQCEILVSVDGIIAAGAIRTTKPIVPSALPDTPWSALEISSGFPAVVGIQTVRESEGVYLSEAAASSSGLDPGDWIHTLDGKVLLAGLFPYPEDGRAPVLANAALVPAVGDGGRFDQCWATLWPSSSANLEFLWLSVTFGTSASAVSIAQLNASLGADYRLDTILAERPTRLLLPVIFTLLLGTGWLSVWTRRLELASAQHAGVSWQAQLLQTTIEAFCWILPTGIAISAVVGASIVTSSVATVTALASGAWFVGTAVIAGLLGAVLGSLSIRELLLFEYFKHRR